MQPRKKPQQGSLAQPISQAVQHRGQWTGSWFAATAHEFSIRSHAQVLFLYTRIGLGHAVTGLSRLHALDVTPFWSRVLLLCCLCFFVSWFWITGGLYAVKGLSPLHALDVTPFWSRVLLPCCYRFLRFVVLDHDGPLSNLSLSWRVGRRFAKLYKHDDLENAVKKEFANKVLFQSFRQRLPNLRCFWFLFCSFLGPILTKQERDNISSFFRGRQHTGSKLPPGNQNIVVKTVLS